MIPRVAYIVGFGIDWYVGSMAGIKGGPGSGNFGHEGRPGEVGGSGSGDLSDIDRASIIDWSNLLFQASASPAPSENAKEGLRRFQEALDKIPKYQGTIYRTMVLNKVEDFLDGKLKPNESFNATRPLSASKSERQAIEYNEGSITSKQAMVVFQIQSKSGADISSYVSEEYRDQQEVIMRPGSSYVVHSVIKQNVGEHGGPVLRVKMVEKDYSNTYVLNQYLAKIKDAKRTKSFTTNKSASTLLSHIFDPRKATRELVDRLLPILAIRMAEAARNQMLSMGIDVRRRRKFGRKLATKATTATRWLADNPEDIDKLEEMLADLDLPVNILTELPEWMKKSIVSKLDESFQQDYWDNIAETTMGNAETVLRQGLEEGWSIRDMAKQLREDLGGDEYARNRAFNIARTESGNALNGARKGVMDQLEADLGDRVPMKATWLSVLGNTTRDAHADLDGVPADEDGLWDLNGVRVPWPGHIDLPPGDRCNCFLGDALVAGNFVGAQRAWYEGAFTEIITRNGAHLTLTVNHPVVTSKGFVAAGKLNPGDQVLTYRTKINPTFCTPPARSKHNSTSISWKKTPCSPANRSVGTDGTDLSLLSGRDDIENKPTSIEKVFEAFLAGANMSCRTPFVKVRHSQMNDFYGDGVSIHGQIEIVRTDWELLQDGDFGQFKKQGNAIFVLSDFCDLVDELSFCPSDSARQRINTTTSGIPCFVEASLDSFLPIGNITPSGSLAVGKGSEFDSCFEQSFPEKSSTIARFLRQFGQGHSLRRSVAFDDLVQVGNEHCIRSIPQGDSSFGKQATEYADIESCFFGESVDGFSSDISFDEIVEVRRFYSVGHVYDLQSEDGFIIAKNPGQVNRSIVTSNCQCSVVMEFGMDDDAARGLIEDYQDRIGETDLEGEAAVDDLLEKGGPGSGNFGHEGRPGEVGGSGSGEGGVGNGMPSITNGTVGSDVVRARYELFYSSISDDRRSKMSSMADEVAAKSVWVATTQASLNKVLAEGRFRSAHEVGKSNGYFDAPARLSFEEAYFGDSPIYGYMSDTGQAGKVTTRYPDRGDAYLVDDVGGYGNVRVLLKDNVRAATTFVDGDSWDYNSNGVRDAVAVATEPGGRGYNIPVQTLASPVNSPSYRSMLPTAADAHYLKTGDVESGGYFEAQVHGDLSKNDIARVVFYNKDPGKKLLGLLTKNGIPWERKDYVESSVSK